MEDARRGAGYESFEEIVEDSLRQGDLALKEALIYMSNKTP